MWQIRKEKVMTHPRAHVFSYRERLRGSDAHVTQNIQTGMTDVEFYDYYGVTKVIAGRIIQAFKLMDRTSWNASLLLQATELNYFPFTSEITEAEKSRNAMLSLKTELDIKNSQELEELSSVFLQEEGLRWMTEKGHHILATFLQREENRSAITGKHNRLESRTKTTKSVKHTIKNRTQPLNAEILKAKETALDKTDPSSVWTELCKLAEQKIGCLLGLDEKDIKYKSGDVVCFFKKRNLNERMKRAATH